MFKYLKSPRNSGLAKLKLAAMLAAAPLALVTCASTSLVNAGIVNIGQGPITNANADGLVGPGDPNNIGTGSNITVSLNGSASVTNDILLVLLLPNNGGSSASTPFFPSDPINSVTLYNNYPNQSSTGTGSSAFTSSGFSLGTGSASYKSGGYWGELTGGKLAAFLGTGFNASNQTANFFPYQTTLNPSVNGVTGFGVYTIELTTGAISVSGGSKPVVDLLIPGGLPEGSIVAAYTDTGKSTVWTNDGGINGSNRPGPLPEPASLAMLGAGALPLLALRRRKVGKA